MTSHMTRRYRKPIIDNKLVSISTGAEERGAD